MASRLQILNQELRAAQAAMRSACEDDEIAYAQKTIDRLKGEIEVEKKKNPPKKKPSKPRQHVMYRGKKVYDDDPKYCDILAILNKQAMLKLQKQKK